MKNLFLILIFLFTTPAAAICNRLADGSCYNDDYMAEEDIVTTVIVKDPSDTYVPSKVELPSSSALRTKERRPAGGFRPVQTGGSVGDFIDVYDYDKELDTSNGLGSK